MRPEEVFQIKEDQKQPSELSPDQKVLLVLDVVYKFNQGEDRHGADKNYYELISLFKQNYDCEILHGKRPEEGKTFDVMSRSFLISHTSSHLQSKIILSNL